MRLVRFIGVLAQGLVRFARQYGIGFSRTAVQY